MKKIVFVGSIFFVFFFITFTVVTAYMKGKENPDEQFNEKFPFSYFLPAKQYPKDFKECVEYWKMPDKQVNPQYLEFIGEQEKCRWYSNRKMHPILLRCPSSGEIREQKMCGDFECSRPIYECLLEFINPNYTPPTNYETCLTKTWQDRHKCEKFLE